MVLHMHVPASHGEKEIRRERTHPWRAAPAHAGGRERALVRGVRIGVHRCVCVCAQASVGAPVRNELGKAANLGLRRASSSARALLRTSGAGVPNDSGSQNSEAKNRFKAVGSRSPVSMRVTVQKAASWWSHRRGSSIWRSVCPCVCTCKRVHVRARESV